MEGFYFGLQAIDCYYSIDYCYFNSTSQHKFVDGKSLNRLFCKFLLPISSRSFSKRAALRIAEKVPPQVLMIIKQLFFLPFGLVSLSQEGLGHQHDRVSKKKKRKKNQKKCIALHSHPHKTFQKDRPAPAPDPHYGWQKYRLPAFVRSSQANVSSRNERTGWTRP